MKTIYIFFLFIISIMLGAQKKQIKMHTIYSPREFSEIELGPDKDGRNKMTPVVDLHLRKPQLNINIPDKIRFIDVDTCVHIIDSSFSLPVCGESLVTRKRLCYFGEQLNPTLHISIVDDEKWYRSEYDEKPILDDLIIDHEEEDMLEFKNEMIEAKKSGIDEIDIWEGTLNSTGFNLNLFEVIKNMPIKSGLYEVYVTQYGLESNHEKVELIFEYQTKVDSLNQPRN